MDAGEYGQMAGVQDRIVDLDQALRHMDKVLRTEKSVLILEHMDSPDEQQKERQLLCALRSWAKDPEIMHQGSLIAVVVGKVSAVLDEFTKEKAILQEMSFPSFHERLKTVDELARELGVDISETRERLAHATAGLNLDQLRCALREAYVRHRGFPLDFVKELKKQLIRKSGLLEVMEPAPGGFASVGGYQKIKDFIRNDIMKYLREPDNAGHLMLELPRGFILIGPPGTGKSILARALATEINLPIVNLRTENLISKWLGESGHNFRNAINIIEQMSPVIVFIDEIDKLLGQRSGDVCDGASAEMRNVLNQVLEWLGQRNRQSILVGATNRPQDLDEAAIRCGRIDYVIPMLYPDAGARRDILRVHLGLKNGRPVPLALREEERERLLDFLVENTEDFTGAELEHLVNKAKRLAFAADALALEAKHFHGALASIHIDPDMRKRQIEHYMEIARRYARDTDLL